MNAVVPINGVQGSDEVLIKLNCTGLCSSDIHYMSNDAGTPKMSAAGVRSPGHEGAGVVVKLGSDVTNWKLGDRAGVKPIWNTCGRCHNCCDDKENYCTELQNTGLHVTGKIQSSARAQLLSLTRILKVHTRNISSLLQDTQQDFQTVFQTMLPAHSCAVQRQC